MLIEASAQYDAAPEMIELYCANGSTARKVQLLYTMTPNNKRTAEELIISNLPQLPDAIPGS